MPRVRLAAVPLLAGLLPLTAGALGLGEIQLRSALNQPFVADIPVTIESAAELNQLSVELAPAATFERFGLDRPRFLDDLKFQVQREGTRAVVHVTSTQPVSEPFVSLLLDVGWPQGHLLREYTVLLDPPSFAQPGATDGARTVAAPPAAPGPAASAPAIRRAPVAPDAAQNAAQNSGSGATTGSVTTGANGDSYGPVRSNETLWGISDRLRPDSSVSLNRMMVALFRANPEAFAGNINRLRRGAILRVPRGSELEGISGRSATTEVHRQDEEWRSAGPVAAPPHLQLVPPTEKAVGTAPGVGAGTGTGSGASPGDQTALKQVIADKDRLLSVQDSQLKVLQDRVKQLEGSPPVATGVPVPAPSAVTETPVERLPTGQTPPTGQTTAEPALPPASENATKPENKSALPTKRPAGQRKAGGGFFGSLGELVFNGWFLVSAAVVLLAGLFAVFARRRMAGTDVAPGRFSTERRGGALGGGGTQPVVRREDYSVEEVGGYRTQSTPALGRSAAARDAGDSELPLERTISTEGAVELDQADIVAEADFHMAYGLYDQAAELLTRALRDSPDRSDLRLKLLEVYFIWENKSAFLKEAQTFQRQMKGATNPDWNKIVIMGKQICPGEPLFAGAVATTGDAGLDLALADEDGAGVVDISFDEEAEAGLDLDLTGAHQGPASDLLDFDPGSPDDTSVAQPRTAEAPTIEARFGGGDYSPTMETPTLESRGLDTPTMETPTLETPAGGTLETPTLESAVPGMRAGASDSRRHGSADQTEEINLEDLGLDLTGLDAAAGDLGTGLHSALDGDADGAANEADIFDVGSADDEASDLLQGLELDSTAEMRGMALDEGTLDLPAFGNALQKSAAGRDTSGRDTASDTAEHQIVETTAEQPRITGSPGGSLGDASGELSKVDFDIGDGVAEDLEPTSVMTGRRRGPEGPTMTEVGTKLDLARAYVDMGDPDGARSILNEVLEEGDSGQRQEARRLLDDLTD